MARYAFPLLYPLLQGGVESLKSTSTEVRKGWRSGGPEFRGVVL